MSPGTPSISHVHQRHLLLFFYARVCMRSKLVLVEAYKVTTYCICMTYLLHDSTHAKKTNPRERARQVCVAGWVVPFFRTTPAWQAESPARRPKKDTWAGLLLSVRRAMVQRVSRELPAPHHETESGQPVLAAIRRRVLLEKRKKGGVWCGEATPLGVMSASSHGFGQ